MTDSPTDRTQQQIDQIEAAIAKVSGIFTERRDDIQAGIAKHLTVEALFEVARRAIYHQPLIAQCVPMSVAGAIINAGQLGLSLQPALKQCAIVPKFNGKAKVWMAELWVMAAGWRELVLRNPKIVSFEAHAVHKNDFFEYAHGTEDYLRFRPLNAAMIDKAKEPELAAEGRGPIIAGYAMVKFAGGDRQFSVIDREMMRKYLSMSDTFQADQKRKDENGQNAPQYSPWSNWPDQMMAAKASKVLANFLRVMVNDGALGLAVGLDDAIDAGLDQTHPVYYPPRISATEINEHRLDQAKQNLPDAKLKLPEQYQQRVREAAKQVGAKAAHVNAILGGLDVTYREEPELFDDAIGGVLANFEAEAERREADKRERKAQADAEPPREDTELTSADVLDEFPPERPKRYTAEQINDFVERASS